MAKENKQIDEVVKKCKILLLDIEGTTTSISFVKDKLFPYAEKNAKVFLETQWDTDDVKGAVADMRTLALEDQKKGVEGVVSIPAEDATKEDQIKAVVSSMKWMMSRDRKIGPLKLMQGLIWKQGYDDGVIKGHVYDDVRPALEQWKSTEGRKVYIYSSGSVQAQKLLFGQTTAGNLMPLIDGYFDTSAGNKQDEGSYKKIVEEIGVAADEILFLTDVVKEAEAAVLGGLQAVLVSREGNAAISDEARTTFAVITSFSQLQASKKRKTEDQVEIPAKVAKTEAAAELKHSTEKPTVAETEQEPEKMEVEATPAPEASVTQVTVTSESSISDETVPETAVTNDAVTKEPLVTDEAIEDEPAVDVDAKIVEPDLQIEEVSNDITEPVEISTVEPVIEEPEEASDKANGVKLDKTDAQDAKEDPDSADVTPDVVQDVKEVSEHKPTIEEVTELKENLEPEKDKVQSKNIIPEKKCDEIMSLVDDAANPDNIAVKPLLNPILEEMETSCINENTDTNDIVERILDSEQELEMKQCEDIDLDSVKEILDENKDDTENVTETSSSASDKIVEAPPAEPISCAENKIPEEKTESKVSEEKTETKVPEEMTETKVPDEKTETKVPDEKTENKVPEEKTETNIFEEKPKENETKPAEITTEKPIEINTITEEAKQSEPEPKEKELVAEIPESKVEPQLNGNATNGKSERVNGNSSNDEVNSRLTAENGKDDTEVANGANGNTNGTEKGQGDSKVEPEITEIKVKTVPAEEINSDPKPLSTEA